MTVGREDGTGEQKTRASGAQGPSQQGPKSLEFNFTISITGEPT